MAAKARIAVIGAGLMGHGIAQVFALAGHDVTITDSFAANLDTVKARISANLADLGDDANAVNRVTPHADLAATVRDADYVVEAVLEDLALKQALFADTDRYATTFAELGWRPSPGRYTYYLAGDVAAGPAGAHPLPPGFTPGELRLFAVGNIDSDDALDVWTIDADGTLVNPVNDLVGD